MKISTIDNQNRQSKFTTNAATAATTKSLPPKNTTSVATEKQQQQKKPKNQKRSLNVGNLDRSFTEDNIF